MPNETTSRHSSLHCGSRIRPRIGAECSAAPMIDSHVGRCAIQCAVDVGLPNPSEQLLSDIVLYQNDLQSVIDSLNGSDACLLQIFGCALHSGEFRARRSRRHSVRGQRVLRRASLSAFTRNLRLPVRLESCRELLGRGSCPGVIGEQFAGRGRVAPRLRAGPLWEPH